MSAPNRVARRKFAFITMTLIPRSEHNTALPAASSPSPLARFRSWCKNRVKGLIPAILLRHIQEQRHRWSRRPPIGWIRFGSLGGVHPIDPDFGCRWGQPIDRYYIERFLEQHASDIHGHVLEVADNGYTDRLGGPRVSRSDVLHYVRGNPKATIVADLTDAREIPSDSFDCIILTQTLQFIFDFRAATKTLHRILKPGGALLVTCNGISQISRHDMEQWGEYWRFTSLSARRLFTEVFRGIVWQFSPMETCWRPPRF